MATNQTVLFGNETLYDMTIDNLEYKGFWTYGQVLIVGVPYTVKIYEGWTFWEVMW